MAKIFIGVAWPYANGPVHVGHVAGCYLPPDIFARYHRMKGNEVLMVSGSDMHGTPVTVRAEEEGVEPAVLAEKYHTLNAKAFGDLGLTFDLYLNTENETHKEVVRGMFLRLHERGYLYEKDMELPYCPECDRTLPDRYVEGECPFCHYENARGDQCEECGKLMDPDMLISLRCVACSSTPEFVTRRHFFFKLSALEEPLKEWMADKDYWRPHVLNFSRNFLEGGLKDRPVSRDTTYGIEIPIEGNEDKRIYVWFEAFMGYYSMAVEWARRKGEPEAWKEFWQNPECKHYYFLGKDNVPFHTIFWPAVLMAHGDLDLPYDVPANALLRFGGEQFSKSRGVSVALNDIVANYDPDAFRYYISMIMPENRDADCSWKEFVAKNNNELAAAYGNFVHRSLSFTQKNFGEIPEPGESTGKEEEALAEIEKALEEVGNYLEKCEFKRGIKRAMELARFGNQYIDAKAPWKQLKADRAACATTLYTSLHIARALAVMMQPYLPHSSQRLWEMLGEEGDISKARWEEALRPPVPGTKLDVPTPLFEKLELMEMEKSDEVPEELSKLDLRIGEIVEASDHPNADKLVILKVDLGDEQRQLVAGLKQHYSLDQFTGKRIVVLCNLQPEKLRGMMSEGMLLAAVTAGEAEVSLLKPDGDAAPGTKICGTTRAGQISFPEFKRFKLEVGEGNTANFVTGDGDRFRLSADGVGMITDKPMPPGTKIE